MGTLPNIDLEKDILAVIMKHRVPIREARRAMDAVSHRFDSLIIPKDVLFQYRDDSKGDHVTYEGLLADTCDKKEESS